MSTSSNHLSGGARSNNCSSSASSESSGACAPAHVYLVDSNADASGSARLHIMLPYPTDRVIMVRCLIGGVSANVLRTLVVPNRSVTFEIELPNGCALPRVCTRIVLVWTTSSGAPKVLTMTVREMEQEM